MFFLTDRYDLLQEARFPRVRQVVLRIVNIALAAALTFSVTAALGAALRLTLE